MIILFILLSLALSLGISYLVLRLALFMMTWAQSAPVDTETPLEKV